MIGSSLSTSAGVYSGRNQNLMGGFLTKQQICKRLDPEFGPLSNGTPMVCKWAPKGGLHVVFPMDAGLAGPRGFNPTLSAM